MIATTNRQVVLAARPQGVPQAELFRIVEAQVPHAGPGRARRGLIRWIEEGRIQYLEEILEGLEQAPDAIAGLYRGENLGKRVIRIQAPVGLGERRLPFGALLGHARIPLSL